MLTLIAQEYAPRLVSKHPSTFPENYKYSSFLHILCPRNPYFAFPLAATCFSHHPNTQFSLTFPYFLAP